MIERGQGSLLDADAEALVNTVNCVGVMGKGLALLIKQAYPKNYTQYRRACTAGDVRPGRMLVWPTGRQGTPRYIINFPTKRHWRAKSRIDDIRDGLTALILEIKRLGIHSIAVPALGCGNGGLDWAEVRPLIEAAFADAPDVRVLVFDPGGEAAESPAKPANAAVLSREQALLVSLMDTYARFGYRLTSHEARLIGYLIEATGDLLEVPRARSRIGFRVPRVERLLIPIAGRFVTLAPNQRGKGTIEVSADAAWTATQQLEREVATNLRRDRVARLIEGFETPYSLELLAAIHWVTRLDQGAARDPAEAATAIRSWGARPSEFYAPDHIEKAWRQLDQQGWLPMRGGSHT
jgi:O-acetyl-ADP-ribose deacetylase (regulator of RNase III)